MNKQRLRVLWLFSPLSLILLATPALFFLSFAQDGTLHWFAFWSLQLNVFLLLFGPPVVLPLFLAPGFGAQNLFRHKTQIFLGMVSGMDYFTVLALTLQSLAQQPLSTGNAPERSAETLALIIALFLLIGFLVFFIGSLRGMGHQWWWVFSGIGLLCSLVLAFAGGILWLEIAGVILSLLLWISLPFTLFNF